RVGYALLARRVGQVAAGLAAGGFGPGDVLALWAPNLPQWAGVALGAMAAGGAVTGASPAASERELATQLADSRASVLVTVPPLVPVARAAASAAGTRELVALGEADGATPIQDLLAAAGPEWTPPELDPATAVGLLPYSSGTTGLPKGVLLTQANLVTSVRQVGSGLRVGERDTLLAVPPFSHIMGFLVTLAVPLCAGATVVTVPRFDPGRFLELLERHRVTVLVGAPPMLRVLTGPRRPVRSGAGGVRRGAAGSGRPAGAGGPAAGRHRRPGLGPDRDHRWAEHGRPGRRQRPGPGAPGGGPTP